MIPTEKINYSNLGNFRFRKIGKDNLITNESGEWMFLSNKQFDTFLSNKLSSKSPEYANLLGKGFLKANKKRIGNLAGKYLHMNSSVLQGPSLFIFVLTLRCNHRCLYCQITPESPEKKGFDMSQKTAKQGVDLAFETPSSYVQIEFQGGEPLLNWPTLKFIVRYAKKVNKIKKKKLGISLVSNLVLMDKEKLDFLINEGVQISCSFDGPAKVHDKNRIYLNGKSSYVIVSKRIKEIRKQLAKKGEKETDSLGAILTISRFSLPFYKEIIDEYIELGFERIALRPLSPFGLEKKTVSSIGYSAKEFIDFYKKSMDYILEINKNGRLFIEMNTQYALVKILKGTDPNYTELKSPCGAAIGQLAFNYDGGIYSCDEGRMASRMGFENFKLGRLGKNRLRDVIDNETVKTLCVSSCLDSQVACQDCAYKPYCGTCPVANFLEYGNIFPQINNTDKCKIYKNMFDYIFTNLKNKKNRAIFESWLSKRNDID